MTELNKIPFSFENSPSSFWVINSQGQKILRDPGLENKTIGFDWDKYCSKQFHLDDMNYMYWEIFDCYIHESNVVEFHKMAVGGSNGSISLKYDMSTGIGGASIVKEINHSESGFENVMCVTLNKLFEIGILPPHIDFMKIDCEGAEKQILDDLTDDNLGKIKKIAMEFHADILGNEARELITERLASNGFSHFTLFHGNGAEVTLNFWKN